MTTNKPFLEEAGKYWANGDSVVPIVPNAKKPIAGWNNYNSSPPNPQTREQWLQTYGHYGVGLLTGTTVGNGFIRGGFDIDEEKYVAPIKRILRNSGSAKKGKKGLTEFFVTDKETPSMAISIKGKRIADILLKNRQTIVPPTLHPDGMRYEWIGQPIYDVEPSKLPYLSMTDITLIKEIIENPHHEAIMSGESTHDPAVSLMASLAGTFEDEDQVCRFVEAFLPEDYQGNLREELPGMFRSAKEKGLGRGNKTDYEPGTVGPIPMGYTLTGSYVFMHQQKKCLAVLSPVSLSNSPALYDMAPAEHWIENFPKYGPKGRVMGSLVLRAPPNSWPVEQPQAR